MSSTGKRLDLRFGAFACSVQGFDDPVEPVQQILRAIQHLLEESPELSDTAINFDAEAIEQLIGEVSRRAELDEREVEIVPGLVIIHHGAGGDLAPEAEGDAQGDAQGDAEGDAEEDAARQSDWSAAFGAARAGPGTDDRDAGQGEGDAELVLGGAEAGEGSGADDPEELATRLRRVSEAQDAEYGWDDAEAPDDPAAARDPVQGKDGTDESWQAETWHEDTRHEEPDERAAEPQNLFAAEDDAPAGPGDPAPGRNLFAVVDNEADDETDWRRMLTHVGSGAAERAAGTGTDAADQTGAEAEGDAGGDAGESYSPADLAERAGARAVPDLMVAAAAWMVLMKGQTRFTRRDVLDVFDTIPGEHENTPEARIKGFGKAVRNGHLAMIEEGVFGIAQSDLERYQKLL